MLTPLDGTGLAATQGAFARMLLREDGPAQDRRVAVYRNNVRASLIAAVRARFPVVQRIVGQEFLEAMALVFVAHHPPTSPVIAEYGATFADFLEGFEPAAEFPYLADVARLEWARQQAFHAADAEPKSIEQLAAIAPDRLSSVRLKVHPAAMIVASSWPVLSIWTANAYGNGTLPPGLSGETVLISRPTLDVFVNALPEHADLFLSEISDGRTLGEAAAVVTSVDEGFDFATMIATLFNGGAISDITYGTST